MNICECIGCGCDDNHACVDSRKKPCSWLRVSRQSGVGVCSMCPEAVKRWDAGERSIAIFKGKYFFLLVARTELGESLEIRKPITPIPEHIDKTVAAVKNDFLKSLAIKPHSISACLFDAEFNGGKIEIHLVGDDNKPVFMIQSSSRKETSSCLVRTASGVVALGEDKKTPVPDLIIPTASVNELLNLVITA